jgi:hypothetical protein
MASLRVLKGVNEGAVIPLERDRIVLGRNPDCDVVIPAASVSREHAQIVHAGGRHYIDDLKSQNGTYVNNRAIATRTLLKNNDKIRISDFLATFADEQAVVPSGYQAEQLFQALADGAEAGSGRLQLYTSSGGSTEEEFRRLRDTLEVNHVFYVRAEFTSLPRQLGDETSPVCRALGRGFHRLVVLDAAEGLVPGEGRFDLTRFLQHVHERMVRAFDLHLPAATFHAENVSQILKDEPRSLFCFVNVQHVPAADLRRLRGFTQEAHQVLFLCCGERDLASEEADDIPISSIAEATVVSRNAEAGGDLLDMCNRWHQFPGPDEQLQRIVDDLFGLFRQADRCFLIQAEEGTSQLISRVVKTRRAHEEIEARFSRGIVRHCLGTATAYLSDDATRDERVQLSQSVVDFRIRSVMCAPLCRADGKAFGAIQLDTQDRGKKFTEADLRLLWKLASQPAVALDSARLYQEAVARVRLRRDLELAHQVQLSFLPRKLPDVPGYDFFAHYESVLEMGGDYHGFIPLNGGRLAVALGDVAGKGVPAALLMAKLSSDIRYALLTEADPGRAVSNLNDLLYEFTGQMDRFVTLAVAVLDPARHAVSLVNAGHVPPLLYRPGTGLLEAMPKERAGVPLGILEGFAYEAPGEPAAGVFPVH